MPFDLFSLPFCWLTISHWSTNFVNCGRASHRKEKQGTAVLFVSQKPGCLQWFQTQPSSSLGSPCIARTERKSSQGKAEVGASVSISTTCGVMKGTYTLLNPSAPLIWNFICFCVAHSGYRGNLQRSYSQLFTFPLKPTQTRHSLNCMGIYVSRKPRTQMQRLLLRGTLTKPTSEQWLQNTSNTSPSTCVLIVYWTTATLNKYNKQIKLR